MKIKALQRFRRKLANHEPVYGLWITLESASITEIAVALGMDWVVVDAEHGHLDWKEINEHIRAALRSETVVLVRIAERSTTLSKRALDIGADGVVIPWMESAADLTAAIRDCRYPAEGRRGIGGERATVWGQCLAEHTSEANEHVLVVPIIESVAAIPNIPAMCQVEGSELFLFGPADFSASAGYRGSWEGPGIAEQILQSKDAMRAAGKYCGLLTTSHEDLSKRREQGFQMLGVGSDCGLLLRSLHQSLQVVQRDRAPATSLNPDDGRSIQLPQLLPPEEATPDRNEVISGLHYIPGEPAEQFWDGGSEKIQLEPGIVLQALVGKFNGARGLFTGVVTLQPASTLTYHTHPCSESITVLEGEAEFSVEGRTYRLGPLDNITIPRWLPHQAHNPNSNRETKLHVSLAMSVPERVPCNREFAVKPMSADSQGTPGFERVTRFSQAERQCGVGPGAEFIDYFNASLMPGIEMSGGFARFAPTGRLPDHLHDFDESICIIRGVATCMVEGRTYALENCATAMVPRGRVHYFVNESSQEMDMIWVYAGPMPERIIVAPGFQRPLLLPDPHAAS